MYDAEIDDSSEREQEREQDAARRREFNELPALVRLNRFEVTPTGLAALMLEAMLDAHDPDTCACNNDGFGLGPCRECRAVFARRREEREAEREAKRQRSIAAGAFPLGQMTDVERARYFAPLSREQMRTLEPAAPAGPFSALPLTTPESEAALTWLRT